MRPPPSSTRWQDCFSLEPPSWRRSEVLDALHPVDDVVNVLRRVKLVEAGRPMGPAAQAAYEQALCLMDRLHELVRVLPQSHLSDHGPAVDRPTSGL